MKRQNVLTWLLIAVFLGGCQTQPTRSPEIRNLEERAAAGDADAQFKLASAYDFGHGVNSNGAAAYHWYRKAADQGHAEAQNSLGSAYQAEKNYREALIWYQKAADQNHPLAINNLGYLHDLGLGVPQDRKKGYSLYLKSANLGWAEAMFNLANMYGAGQLGNVDYYQAYVWCSRSARYALPGWRGLTHKSRECIKYLTSKLTHEQIKHAQSEADQWEPYQPLEPML
ncbi:MAG: tetratricopeptide repeat protein [Chromatiales bacterium]|jgi:TPR repeat protein